MAFDPFLIRNKFPALNQKVNGVVPVFFDGPGGTQVPQPVLEAMTGYLGRYNSNLTTSPFFAVEKTHEVVREARRKAAAFVNGHPEEIIFGANMSTLTAHISRALSREWKAGDEIIVTDLDHYANVSFWVQAAQDRGIKCHAVRIHPEDCTLDYEHLESLLSERTKLVAFTLASNLCGSRTDAKRIISAAKSVGALSYIDSVHAAPHFLPDVQDLDCDFLGCSGYKFFGPHMGFVYGKRKWLEHYKPYKVKPATEIPPESWETGTKSFEALAGFSAAIDYLCFSNNKNDLRGNLKSSYEEVMSYEQSWSRRFIGLGENIKGLKILGISDVDRLDRRASTFAFTINGFHPQEISDFLAKKQISTGAGNFYAVGITDTLGLTDKGGVVRAGAVHYNTIEELGRMFEALDQLVT